jgi:hypothetical protein
VQEHEAYRLLAAPERPRPTGHCSTLDARWRQYADECARGCGVGTLADGRADGSAELASAPAADTLARIQSPMRCALSYNCTLNTMQIEYEYDV